MFTIKLQQIKLFGYHGVHKEESIIGGEFELNIEIFFEEKGMITALHETINYANVYEIVQQIFSIPTMLLETLAQKISMSIYESDNRIQKINISIDKINAPISNFIGRVGVTYATSYPTQE
jgi:7,8-dihydroneopterin aldolase/epimerase/oxygenase